ncbi:MAG TPA: hypothetical protein DCL73_08235 [Treponema sp.]|nr:hypothetical protein [Treponema sp.]
MFDKDAFFENIKELFTGDKKITAYVSCALIIMTCTALTVFIVQKTKKPAAVQSGERELVADQKLIVPDGPEVQKGYITARRTKDKWDDADAERWLTLPSKKELDDLGRANDQLVLDITGAAP